MLNIPKKYSNVLFALLLSDIMSGIVSAVSIIKNTGIDSFDFTNWLQAWMISWAIAFPCVLIFAPVVRKIVAKMTKP